MTVVTSGRPASPIIDIDLPCVGCGYNLRTQPMAASCPECGRPVVETWHSKLLHESELGPLRANGLPWLRAMRRGLGTAALAWSLALVGALYGLSSDPGPPYADEWFVGSAWLAPLVGVWVLSHLSVWHLMYARNHRWTLRLGRVAVVLAVGSVGLLYLNERWVYFYQRVFGMPVSYGGGDWARVTVATGTILMLLWPVLAAATFGRLVQIAWIANRRVAAPILSLIGIVVAGINALIAYFGFALGVSYAASGELAPMLLGPTGTLPFLWTTFVYLFREPPSFRGADLGWVALGLVIVGLVYSATITLGVLLFSLRKTLTRAILLSEESASSFRSSPSPRPPA